MRAACPAFFALVALAACATDNSPQAACDRQSYEDPVIKEMIAQQAGNPWLMQNDRGDLNRLRHGVVLQCLADRGVIRQGGVEAVVPPK